MQRPSTARCHVPARLAVPEPQLYNDPISTRQLHRAVQEAAEAACIYGTGGPVEEDRTLLIDGRRIVGLQAAREALPGGYRKIDASGHSVLPGIIGMHDHEYYMVRAPIADGKFTQPVLIPQMTFSSPRMYLAGGVTTPRTARSVEPYVDLYMKTKIDTGILAGPHMDVAAPYLESAGSRFIQMHPLQAPAEAARMVNFRADQGFTSFKASCDRLRFNAGRSQGRS